MDYFVGFDPGSPPYAAVVRSDGELMTVSRPEHMGEFEHMPNGQKPKFNIYVDDMCETLETYVRLYGRGDNNLWLVCEQVWVRNNQGSVSTLKYVSSAKFVEALACALRIPFRTVGAKKWKYDLGFSVGASKQEALNKAQEIFPTQASRFRLLKNHNEAEAALIGYWGALYTTSGDW